MRRMWKEVVANINYFLTKFGRPEKIYGNPYNIPSRLPRYVRAGYNQNMEQDF
jgi:hypothetical protein